MATSPEGRPEHRTATTSTYPQDTSDIAYNYEDDDGGDDDDGDDDGYYDIGDNDNATAMERSQGGWMHAHQQFTQRPVYRAQNEEPVEWNQPCTTKTTRRRPAHPKASRQSQAKSKNQPGRQPRKKTKKAATKKLATCRTSGRKAAALRASVGRYASTPAKQCQNTVSTGNAGTWVTHQMNPADYNYHQGGHMPNPNWHCQNQMAAYQQAEAPQWCPGVAEGNTSSRSRSRSASPKKSRGRPPKSQVVKKRAPRGIQKPYSPGGKPRQRRGASSVPMLHNLSNNANSVRLHPSMAPSRAARPDVLGSWCAIL